MFLARVSSLEKEAIEVLKGQLYFWVARSSDAVRAAASVGLVLQIDSELTYEPFASDFGPLHLGCTYRFCNKLNSLLRVASKQKQPVIFVTGNHAHKKANSAVLLGAWLVIYGGFTADAAYEVIAAAEPFLAFRDASCGPSQFHMTVKDCLQGLKRAKDVGILDWHLPDSQFDLTKYEHYEQVLNGDFNWILPGKLLAFSGPTSSSREHSAYGTLGVVDYVPIFRQEGVTSVVRLNKAQYDKRLFTQSGLRHHDLYFPDGTCPPDAILSEFLSIAESERGALAIHCKAGLGRTGTLIGCYLMKHYGFTAPEVIAYIRLCRPGSILGPQQRYLLHQEQHMHALGKLRPRAAERRAAAPTRTTTMTSARSLASTRSGCRRSSALQDSAAVAAMVRTAQRPDVEAPHPAALLPAHPAASGLVQPASIADEAPSVLGARRASIASTGRGSSGASRIAGARSSSLVSGRTKVNAAAEIDSASSRREKQHGADAQISPAFSKFGIGARAERDEAGAAPQVMRTLAANGQPRKVMSRAAVDRVTANVAASAAARAAEGRRTSPRRSQTKHLGQEPLPAGVKTGMFRNT